VSYSSEVLVDSPHLYYRLGDTSGTVAVDSSGNGRSGTGAGTLGWGTAGLLTGDADTALAVTNGGGGRVTTPALSGLSAGTISFEFWLKTTDATTSKKALTTSVSSGGGLEAAYNNGTLTVLWSDSFGVGSLTLTATGLNDGNPHHVAYASAGQNATARLYVDGAQVDSGTTPNGPPPDVTAVVLGSQFFGFTVTYDEFAFYASTLSGARILAHYNAGTGGGAATYLPPDPAHQPRHQSVMAM
jgi:hypothetical protein